MATQKKKEAETDAGTLERLSKRGEEAINRLADELGKNERVSDAVSQATTAATTARDKLDDAGRRMLGQVGLATTDELEALRKQVARLEKRVGELEGTKSKPKPRKPAAKTTRARASKAS